MITWLHDANTPFPDTRRALPARSEAPGLLAAGGELTPRRLQMAYSRGIFPWFSEGQPVLWWSPDPRMVLPVADFKLSHSLRKTLQRFIATPGSEVRIDGNFRRVMEHCARVPRAGQDGTWIVPAMIDAYSAWHATSGIPHSFETWIGGELVGGLYGVALGRMFFGESMFSLRTDASKIALAALVAFCRAHGISLVDCQQNTGHLASLGAREISRAAFEQHLGTAVPAEPVHDWTYHPSLWTGLDARLAAAPSPVKGRHT
ncbi:leucyl/phenylalanyl-tRNA--protein transferase [Methylibium rhizosphaerae]|uniref:leucyl/phenylalanyl-tRNA--protein transferase n=1 Tax=Methylibium rhizosphaerae TaxID=2570323 RepID=UPI001126C053|nr:leucyl/phenylalanyl-tRNA--protein transferase [Methylibium rhizosphaerae]